MAVIKSSVAQLKTADWKQLKKDVLEALDQLKLIAQHLEEGEIVDEKIANELILPNLRLLAVFCEDVHEEKNL